MDNPFLMAFIKFAVLGTIGEIAAKLITKKKLILTQTLFSMLVWGVLGIIIKFVFTGMHGFVDGLTAHNYLPEGIYSKAFFTSLFTNWLFGPWVIILHRLFDNFYYRKIRVPQEGLRGAMLTLLWFWIPAHTVTFALPNKEWQITLAAVWSFVLGLILGIYNRKAKK